MRALVRYRTALSHHGVARVLAAAFVCRLLAGMVSLSLLLAAERATGSYATAGAVSAAYAVALAFTSPLWGRVADRRGPRAALAVAASLQLLTFALFVFLTVAGAAWLLLVGSAFLAGACTPPAAAVSNTAIVRYVPDKEAQRTLFALSGFLTYGVFVLGPLIVAGVVFVLAPVYAIVLCALTSAAGVWWLRSASMVRHLDEDRPSLAVRFGLVSNWRQAHILLVVVVGAFAIGALEVSVVAHADDLDVSAGLFLAVLACGGACGSFLYGGAKLPGSLLAQLIAALTLYGCATLVMGFGPGVLFSCAVLFLIGVVSGPADAIEYLLVGRYSEKHAQSQGFALVIAANWVGFAAGSAAGGRSVQYVSIGFAAVSAAVAALAAAVSLLLPLILASRSRDRDLAEYVDH
jgi:MFS family permease